MNQYKTSTSTVEVSHEGKFQERDLDLAQKFADSHENFDDTFVLSLRESFDTRGYLTNKQYTALLNVMEQWDMHSWGNKNGMEV